MTTCNFSFWTLIATMSAFLFWSKHQCLLQITFEISQCVGHLETKDLVVFWLKNIPHSLGHLDTWWWCLRRLRWGKFAGRRMWLGAGVEIKRIPSLPVLSLFLIPKFEDMSFQLSDPVTVVACLFHTSVSWWVYSFFHKLPQAKSSITETEK